MKTDARGNIDVDDLRGKVDEHTAGLMLTNPSTLGLFDENIEEIRDIFHGAGALMYYDGANLNAVCGISRPGDMGFDVVHINLHKTFSQPHGGGGPGGGPIAVRAIARAVPAGAGGRARRRRRFRLDYDRPKSIGKVRAFSGPFGVFVRSYAFIRSYGPGLREMSEVAVLNANYLLARLKDAYDLPFDRLCMHEFVLSARTLKREHGVSALDVAKRLMDYGFHPPTIYFPLIVPEALMIEPTETEAKETLDAFIDAMLAIAREAADEPGAAARRAARPAGAPARRGARREEPGRALRVRGASGRAGRRRPPTRRHRRGRSRWPSTSTTSRRTSCPQETRTFARMITVADRGGRGDRLVRAAHLDVEQDADAKAIMAERAAGGVQALRDGPRVPAAPQAEVARRVPGRALPGRRHRRARRAGRGGRGRRR